MGDIQPIHYTIDLEPDLTDFTFAGRVILSCNTSTAVGEISLHLADIAVWSCKVGRGEDFVSCAFAVDPQKEQLRITLPRSMSGDIVLDIQYTGRINDKMAGFYRSTYQRNGETLHMAVTQFQESDARRAFPCFDLPEKKATFDIALTIEPHFAAISNTAVLEEKKVANGKKKVTFARTPKMSTYLVFWGVGEFEFRQDSLDSRVRMVTLPGMQEFGEYGLALGRKALAFCEKYYDIPYPLPKLDLIAIPDFAFGAMENWGAITFRENLLLHYPGVTSTSGEERIFEVIAHEIAHQWFGNLVTPSDWKYIWLNESFATLFGYGVVAHYNPEWDTWEQFLNGTSGSAMLRDGLQENFAIELPGAAEVVINTSTAPIIYSKGGSILRQIQGYMGEETFKKGVRLYLQTHAYDCAASHHLWEAFEQAANQPVEAIMKSWVEQPGFPLVIAKREDNSLVLQQKRFTYLPRAYEQKWLIPLTVSLYSANGAIHRHSVVMDEKKCIIEIDPATVYKINDRQTGFYRVQYDDPENFRELAKMIADKTLPPEDRWGLQNDLYGLVRSGGLDMQDYVDFLSHYAEEDDYLPLSGIAANLMQAYRILEEDWRRKIAELATPWLESILAKIGHEPSLSEGHTITILRDRLIGDAVQYGAQSVTEFALQQFARLRQGAAVHPDIMGSVMLAGAWTGDANIFDWFAQRFRTAPAEHERMNILTAIGYFQDRPGLEKALHYVLDEVPARNKFIPVMAMAANPAAVPLLWGWYVGNLTQIEQFHPMLYERVLAAIIPVAGMAQPDEVRTFFADYLAKKDKAGDVIKLSLEHLEINLRMRELNKHN